MTNLHLLVGQEGKEVREQVQVGHHDNVIQCDSPKKISFKIVSLYGTKGKESHRLI